MKKIVLTTKHEKEHIIARPIKRVLGADLVVPEGIDTDQLGTFTGEIPRLGSMEEVVVQKALLGIKATGIKQGIASEGSFGPHPQYFVIPSDYEMLAFVDEEQDFIHIEKLLSTKTNFAHCKVRASDDLISFLTQVKFPSHRLIVKPNQAIKAGMILKGINDYQALQQAIKLAITNSADETAHIETDMRAHHNPTRRQVIRQLTFKLLRRLQTHCPECDLPGFGLIATEPGLPCELCGLATKLIKSEIFGCVKCAYKTKQARQDQIQFADPRFCDYCNP